MSDPYDCSNFTNGYSFSNVINDMCIFLARHIQGYSQEFKKSDLQIWVGSQELFDILYLGELFDRKTLTILDVPVRVRLNNTLEKIEIGIDTQNHTEYIKKVRFVNLPLMFR